MEGNMNFLISIIIPVYNSGRYLDKTLQSLINQTYDNLQIIVINDGSTDNSEDIIKKYIKNDKRIDYYKIENHGVSYARNYGLNVARGEFIMFVDSDDIIDHNMCFVLLENMIKYEADMSVCSFKIINNQTPINDYDNNLKYNIKQITDLKYACLFNLYKGFLWNKMYKKCVIEKYDLKLDENIHMCEDLLFNFNYLDYSAKVVYTDAILYGYLISNDNSSKKINEKWFSILKTYSELIIRFDDYETETQNLIVLNLLYTLFEARVRCDILKMSYNDICNHYIIDISKVSKYYKNVMVAKNIGFKEKVKLVIFFKVYWIAKKIKTKRLLKG